MIIPPLPGSRTKSQLSLGNAFIFLALAAIGFLVIRTFFGNAVQDSADIVKRGEFTFSFPRESADATIYLRKPTALSIDPQGAINVADPGQNKILVFSNTGEFLQSIGRSGQGPGDLLAPEKICFDDANTLYVYESANGRIQLFNGKREYIKGFKVYKYIHSLKVWGDKVYCACMQQVPDRPLIEILDLDGKKTAEIGNDSTIERIEAYRRKSLDIKRFDISNSGKIWFAWEYFSWIRGFSLEGTSLGTIDLATQPQAEWSRQNVKTFLKAPSADARYRSVIFAIRSKGESLYVLSSSEEGPEIIICPTTGGENIICKLNSIPKGEFHYYKDFDLSIDHDVLTFFLLQAYPESRVDVFRVSEPWKGLH
jgi:hypothetical protein